MKSDRLIERHLQAIEKFDYFVTGVAIALVGWFGGREGPLVIAEPAGAAYVLALACLLVAALAGLKRIESTTTSVRLNALALLGEETASLRRRAARSGGVLVDEVTGKQIDRNTILKGAQGQQEHAQHARALLEKEGTKGQKWYRARDLLLIAGLLLLIVGRLLDGL